MAIGEEIDGILLFGNRKYYQSKAQLFVYIKLEEFKYGILIENMDQKSKELLEGFIEE
jgi:hypothetical protein